MAKEDIRDWARIVMHASAVRYSDTPEQTSAHFLSHNTDLHTSMLT